MYYAHSTNDESRANWQLLLEHLVDTADLAEKFGQRIGIAKAARLAGLLHDLGKYTPEFQARLDGAEERVDHSTAGAAIARRLASAAKSDDKLVAELIAYAIAGHHAGLPDKQGETFSTLSERLKGFSDAALDPAWKSQIAPDLADLLPAFNWEPKDRRKTAFQIAFLGRMIFSCLVDADFKDTERFYARIEKREVDREWPALQSILPSLIEAFDRHMNEKRNAETTVNRLRSEILDDVRTRASDAPGLFTLTVPTGGGKTLASLGFALDHARTHGHERIIYAIPFTAIIDQTAAVFRNVLGDDIVLEHHSAIESGKYDPRNLPTGKDKIKLAMEDWAAPVIVTTNVQLFESLFAARTSRSRKLHNIANSVIILDEAQTLPRPLLVPCVQVLDELARNYGCTIVLCTATQPALDARNFAAGHPAALPLVGRELAPDPARLSEQLERVTIARGGDMDDAMLVDALAGAEQALVIVNTRKHALTLYRAAQAAGLDGLVHLTTRQCAAHRRDILERVRRMLKDKAPCRLIATSLVEAGVDLDFPKGWRAEAGLDQIAQAAGRINREGQRPLHESVLTVFQAPDNPPPTEIKGLSGDMARVANKHEKLLSPAAIEDFFREVYWRFDAKGLDAKAILDDFRIGSGETDFSYRKVAEKFRMIESGMLPVIIPRDDKARAAIAKLGIDAISSGAIARELQTYLVQVPPQARARLIECGHVTFSEERLRRDQFAVLMTKGLYQEDVGLVWEDAEYLADEQFML
ncbi:MAG: CRISPR-associated endonuclease Cas3'' [Pseudomonadota bacterium]